MNLVTLITHEIYTLNWGYIFTEYEAFPWFSPPQR